MTVHDEVGTKPTRPKAKGNGTTPPLTALVAAVVRPKPQPHGGALKPWRPGQSGNPSGSRGTLYEEAVRLARERLPRAIERLGELMESKDERVAAVACNSIADRVMGKPKEPTADRERPRPDLSVLTDKEREQLMKLVTKAAKAGGFPGVS